MTTLIALVLSVLVSFVPAVKFVLSAGSFIAGERIAAPAPPEHGLDCGLFRMFIATPLDGTPPIWIVSGTTRSDGRPRG